MEAGHGRRAEEQATQVAIANKTSEKTWFLCKDEEGNRISIYFNISMPVMHFLIESHHAMLDHGVKLYAEIFVNAQGERQYSAFESEKIDLFASYFNDTAYNSFFFSCYPIQDATQIKSNGYFYDTPSSNSIEVAGGRETDKSRELIQMRMLSKNPNKQIRSFYQKFQKDLKKISGLQKHPQKNYFYLPTNKIIIPANPHSQNSRDIWEDFNLSKMENVE
ncbi:hypothetical protein [Paenibacillus sinopodophylli]|uniref:hypothetical protein n=1 Tax=Paenibacillus sinopodophylli TaxID=1837342 RepID=UPI00110CE874|nr:hypothetical protein [Paenibacillus sinopodophylli]